MRCGLDGERARVPCDLLLDLIAEAVTIVDHRGRITYANPRAEEVLGLERCDIAGRAYDDPRWCAERPQGGELPPEEFPFARVMASPERVEGAEMAIVHPDGTRVVISVNAVRLREPSGSGPGMLASFRDITEVWKARRALAQRSVELERRVSERTAELETAQDDILKRLALAAGYRDDATGRHATRVAELAGAIARELGLSEPEMTTLYRAALLHDVGKIGVPDSVLLKPGDLTDREFDLIRRHTAIGARILSGSSSRLLQMAEQVARYHHERWDGTGYEGLAGAAIPMPARIVAVADVFDALTSDRPYRPAFSTEEAVELVRRGAGFEFDARVVEAFLRTLGSSAAEPAAGEQETEKDHEQAA